ncbi:MAG: bifunctional phosphoribosyl-AMP cyclohydrolase/phosphoribosyl-ATP diphosphatase HisIE [Candidatus Freyarchaeota archaeon]|nr:bifunctional phosphoribosyl-AMP cyclohydrolase/phosphoribosyl-ATP diphosphatase HisIE [Candidatus Freyrarchaeum guaymaensis]
MNIKEVVNKLDFQKGGGIIPAIIQDVKTKEVLMLGYMDKEALERTLTTGYMHYYSRTRRRIWMKGEESKHYQLVREAYCDCDYDALLFKVEQKEACCHEGYYTCFHNVIRGNKTFRRVFQPEVVYSQAKILDEIFNVIMDRMEKPRKGSYVSNLTGKGLNAVLQKVGEEAVELIIAAKDGGRREVVSEAADLLFHVLVLLAKKGVKISEVYEELRKRRESKS